MTQVIEHVRRTVESGDNIALDFDFAEVMPAGSTIDPADVDVTLSPTAQVTAAAPVVVSGLIVQVTFNTSGATIGQMEHLIDVLAESGDGIKKHLFAVLVIHPPAT